MTSRLDAVLAELGTPRAWSLVVTIYGDAVVPRGGVLWLGTLLEIMAAFGVGPGVVRTAMSRLAADGWLARRRIGRNSFYGLAEKGREAFAAATERIYFAAPTPWDGRIRIAFLDAGDERGARRGRLEAAGFGALASGVLISPAPSGGEDGAVLLEAEAPPEAARRLAARAWPIPRIAEHYRRFLAAFAPLDQAGDLALGDLESLALRVLLIHEYRRIILRDPLLPEALLPEDWPGREARRLCASLYRAVLPASEGWLDAHAINEAGPLPPPGPRFHARFRDLALNVTKRD